jgi:nicotinamidase-related amidase
MKDSLLLVDVVTDFRHEDGDALLASFRERHSALKQAISDARERELPVVYANDNFGAWDGDARRLIDEAANGEAGDLVAEIAPREGDRFVVKPRYSAFDHTPLVLLLRELEIERILLAGAATEMCVVQTAIDAREEGFKVSILADACATTDPEIEALALRYAEEIVGARVERAGH